MVQSKQQIILDILRNGDWVLDNLSDLIELKLQKTASVEKNFKELAILYYGNIVTQELPFFIESSNVEIANYIISKINKGGIPSSYSQEDRKLFLKSLDALIPLMAGGQLFLKKLSFAKIDTDSFRSASSPHLLGIIILTTKINLSDRNELLKSVIHELAHQELFLINFFDLLTKSESIAKTKFSPYQKESRPPIGRLHSMYALYRMIQFSKFFNINYDNELRLFKETGDSLKGDLTSFGEELVLTLEERVC